MKITPLEFELETVNYEMLYNSYISCCKRKRSKLSTKKFKANTTYNLQLLLKELNDRTYTISQTRAFVVFMPKTREIWCSMYRDRIVHHLVYDCIAWWFEEKFILDSYSCIKGRGTLFGAQRVAKFARSITNNWDKKHRLDKAFYLKLDISNYFMSMSQIKLWDIIKDYFPKGSIMGYLLYKIIYNDYKYNCIVSNKKDFSKVPPEKSAWNAKDYCGLPIGNLLSQFLSNVYLNELDQYVKNELRVKYYGRYVDDMVFLAESRKELKEIHQKVKIFMREKLYLELAEHKTKLDSVFNGIDFVGYRILPWRVVPRKRTIGKFKYLLHKAKHVNHKNVLAVKRLTASINSYLGLLKHDNSYEIRKYYCEEISKYIYLTPTEDYTSMYPDKSKFLKFCMRDIRRLRDINAVEIFITCHGKEHELGTFFKKPK